MNKNKNKLEEEIDASEGIETEFGYMEVTPSMIDTDGTNLEAGVDVRIEGEFKGEVIGASSIFESVEALEEWFSANFDPYHKDHKDFKPL
jgi:hypothetical protein